MAVPPLITEGYPAETWTALLASIAAVVSLVGVLYSRLNSDIKEQQVQLARGQDSFIEIGNRLVSIGEQLKNAHNGDVQEKAVMENLGHDIKEVQDRILVIETEHKHCQLDIAAKKRNNQ